MNKSEFYISSKSGKNNLHCILWEPESEPKAVLQISHGMVEYLDRYDRFARFLNEAGIVVVGNDHLGHGKSAATEDELGYFAEKEPSKTVVDDLYQLTLQMKEKYKGIPYFVLGHSMGSFMIRRYIMTYGNEVDGVIISGTGSQPAGMLFAGKTMTKFLTKLKGERHRSALLDHLCFASYNKKIKNLRTDKDWLTKDTEIVDAYRSHPFCTFLFTLNGFKTLFSTVGFIQEPENINKIPKDLPVFLVAGEEDPVGNYGKGVREVYECYQKNQIQDVKLKLYPDDRHEILNETDYKVVYQDILSWIEQQIHNIK